MNRFLVVDAHRLIREVSAGRHERNSEIAQKEVVQRRIREKRTEQRIPRRHLPTQLLTPRFWPTPEKDDRTFGRGQHSFFKPREFAKKVSLSKTGNHHCERFFLPVFPF